MPVLDARIFPPYKASLDGKITSFNSNTYRPHALINFDQAYTSISGTTYTLKLSIPPYSKYKFTESSEQSTTSSSVSKTYTNSGSGVSGYILINGNNSR